MLWKFSIFATFAIFATLSQFNAEETTLDPAQFIKESIPELYGARAKCQLISSPDAELEDKDEAVQFWSECGKVLFEIASKAATFDFSKIEDVKIRQTIKNLRNMDERYKLGEDLLKVTDNFQEIRTHFSTADIESYDDSDTMYSITEIHEHSLISQSDDITEMNYYWSKNAEKAGADAWEYFFDFADIIQKKANMYKMTAAEFWYPNYSEETMSELETFVKELKPFYEQLHAYIRSKLFARHGVGVIKPNGPIPAPFFQQILDRTWSAYAYYDDDFPQSNIESFEKVFSAHNATEEQFIEYAEKFYTSLGFDALGSEYLKKREVTDDADSFCEDEFEDKNATTAHFSGCANDIGVGKYLGLHEKFGRLHSAKLQKEEHWFFWGDNAWGKTIGHAVELSAQSKNHMVRLLLANEDEISDEMISTFNARLAFLNVFGLTRDYVNIRVVTDFLTNKVEKDALNKHYWHLLEEYAGVEPPIDRNDESLDLPYSLIWDVFEKRNFIRDYKSLINVFEVYKAACHMHGYTGPMHECNFYEDKKVGEAFKEILSTGFTKPFKQTIQPLIPSYTKLSVEPLLSYFGLTFNWMKRYNKKHNLIIGWDHSKKVLNEEVLKNEKEALKFVEEASTTIYKLFDQIALELFSNKYHDDEFQDDYYGNTFWKVSKAAVAASEITDISMKARQFDMTKIKSKPLQKALYKLAQVADVFVLSGEDLVDFVYSKQQLFNISLDSDIFVYKDDSDDSDGVPYNPYVLNVFRTSKDAAELKYYWDAWRGRNRALVKELLKAIFKNLKSAAKKLGMMLG